jgi:NADH dehydrogenase
MKRNFRHGWIAQAALACCAAVLWAAGVRASPLGAVLAKRSGAGLDRSGRVLVEPDLSLPKHPEIFVIGDVAHFSHQTGQPLPGVAPVAMQQGRYVAKLLLNKLAGKSTVPFRYNDRGNMAIIGRGRAVVDLGRLHLAGFWAWLVWRFIHLLYLVEFENRVLVLIQWGWNYLRRNRAARLITKDVRDS